MFGSSVRVKPFEKKIWLASPTMHGAELTYMKEAFDTNWMSTVGANINEVERVMAEKIGCADAVALSCGTAALRRCTCACAWRESVRAIRCSARI